MVLARKAVGVAAVLALLTVSGQALAQSGDDSLAGEYAEDIPTATGPKHTAGNGSSSGSSAAPPPLPGPVRSNLYKSAGKDAPALEKVATSPRLGAPGALEGGASSAAEDAGGGAVPAALDALGAGGGGVSAVLLGVLAAITLLAAAAAVLRRREPRSDASIS